MINIVIMIMIMMMLMRTIEQHCSDGRGGIKGLAERSEQRCKPQTFWYVLSTSEKSSESNSKSSSSKWEWPKPKSWTMLQAHLGNALPHQLGAEAEVVAVGPACLTMTGNALFWSCFRCEQLFSGIAAWMTTWKGVHVNGKRQVLREVLLLPKSYDVTVMLSVDYAYDWNDNMKQDWVTVYHDAGFPRGRGGGIGFERQTSERGWSVSMCHYHPLI